MSSKNFHHASPSGKRVGRVWGGEPSNQELSGHHSSVVAKLPVNVSITTQTEPVWTQDLKVSSSADRTGRPQFPSVLTRIRSRVVLSLIDTGSQATLIDSALLSSMLPQWQDDLDTSALSSLRTVKGDPMVVWGKTYLPLKVGDFECTFPFFVVENSYPAVILGSDFLEAYCCLVNYEDKTLEIGKRAWRVPLAGPEVPIQVTPFQPVSLPPLSETLISCRVTNGLGFGAKPLLFEPNDLPAGIVTSPCVVSLDQYGRVPVRLMNTTTSELKLKMSGVIGNLERIETVSNESSATFEKSECDALMVGTISDCDDWLQKFHFGKDLTDSQRQALVTVLKNRQTAISKNDNDIGSTDVIMHDINTGGHVPVSRPPYRVNPIKQQVINQEVDRLLTTGVIEASASPWASPVILVKKSDGNWRLCIDYRSLNEITQPVSYPMPRMDDIFDSLRGSKFFCTLDLNQAYYQVKINPRDVPKTAFVTRDAQYQFIRMPFGLNGAPSTCQRLMNSILEGLLFKCAIAYLDDIIVFGTSFELTLKHLDEVLARLAQHGIKVKPNKCHLFESQMLFLGHVVTPEGIHTDPNKVDTIRSWPQPLNGKEVKSFLGLINYYQRFIPNLSQLASPLRLLEKAKIWNWTADCQDSFNKIKELLTTAPVLGFPDFSPSASPFILDCDASDSGVGAVLSQEQDGKLRVLAYGSKALSKEQRSYCPTQKEMFSLVYFIEYYREYLIPRPFIIRTDHSALKWLRRAHSSRNDMLVRWNTILDNFTFDVDGDILGRLQEYNFQILYRPGKYHGNADSLSRRPFRKAGHEECPSCNPEVAIAGRYLSDDAQKILSLVTTVGQSATVQESTLQVAPVIHSAFPALSSQTEDHSRTSEVDSDSSADPSDLLGHLHILPFDVDLRQAQEGDPDIFPVLSSLVQGHPKPAKPTLLSYSRITRILFGQYNRLELKDGVLIRKVRNWCQIITPWKLRSMVLKGAHNDAGHGGLRQTRRRVTKLFWWPDCTQEIEDYVRCCLTCAQTKRIGRHRIAPLQPLPKGYANQAVHLDLAGPLRPSSMGNVYLCVMIDRFTSWIEAIPIPDKTATTVVSTFFQHWVCRYGIPEQLYTDQGQEVAGKLMTCLCTELGIDKIRTSPRHPQADGKVERSIQQIKAGLRSYLAEKGGDWESHVNPVLLNIRTVESASSGFTPAMLTFGRELLLPYESMANLTGNSESSPHEFMVKLRDHLQVIHAQARLSYGKAQRQQKRYFDTKVHGNRFNVGDWIFIRGQPKHTLDPNQFIGPYTISKRFTETLYEVEPARLENRMKVNPKLGSHKKIVHFNNLRPVQTPAFAQIRQRQHQSCVCECPCRGQGLAVDVGTQVPRVQENPRVQCDLEHGEWELELIDATSEDLAMADHWARDLAGRPVTRGRSPSRAWNSGAENLRRQASRRRSPTRGRSSYRGWNSGAENRRREAWRHHSPDEDNPESEVTSCTFSNPDSDTDVCVQVSSELTTFSVPDSDTDQCIQSTSPRLSTESTEPQCVTTESTEPLQVNSE